jgi:hypothetical protein
MNPGLNPAGPSFGIFPQVAALLVNYRNPLHNANFSASLMISDRL